MEGSQLFIEYSENEGGGITAYSGTLEFVDNLNGARSIALGTVGGIAWTFTPNGAVEPLCDGVHEWDGFKLDLPYIPEVIACEGDQAFIDLDARFMAAMHWGTFDLTDEPLDLPPSVLREVVADRGGEAEQVRIFAIGERWAVPERRGSH